MGGLRRERIQGNAGLTPAPSGRHRRADMRPLLVTILVAALCAGCSLVSSWADSNSGIVCQQGVGSGVVRDGDPLAAGEPLAGLDVTSMSAAEVGTAAVEHGLGVTWRYEFDIGEAHGVNGYSECWCIAPPAGRVTQVLSDRTGALIVFVDSGQVLPSARQQPRLGWGCEGAPAAADR
jgi:hypothetical protein